MAPNTTRWRAAADQLLRDGRWHPEATVRAVMSAAVPPHVAIRRHRARNAMVRRRLGYERVLARTVEQETDRGTRSIVTDTIWTALKSGSWERDRERRMVRLTPRGAGRLEKAERYARQRDAS